jgi:hypothetical protein
MGKYGLELAIEKMRTIPLALVGFQTDKNYDTKTPISAPSKPFFSLFRIMDKFKKSEVKRQFFFDMPRCGLNHE